MHLCRKTAFNTVGKLHILIFARKTVYSGRERTPSVNGMVGFKFNLNSNEKKVAFHIIFEFQHRPTRASFPQSFCLAKTICVSLKYGFMLNVPVVFDVPNIVGSFRKIHIIYSPPHTHVERHRDRRFNTVTNTRRNLPVYVL